MQDLQQRFDQAERHARALPARTRKDCIRMADAVRHAMQQASRAQVECRRLHRITSEYERSVAQIEECLQNFESYVIMAKLMKGAP